MRGSSILGAGGLALGLASSSLHAQPIRLQVVEVQSSTSGSVCVTPLLLGERCDFYGVGIAGFVDVLVDDPSAPGTIALDDFSFAFAEDVMLAYSWAPLGALDATLANAAAADASPGVPTPSVLVALNGSFTIADVPTALSGIGTVAGSILGQDVDETFDLADTDPVAITFDGTLTHSDGILTLTVTGPYAQTVDDDVASVAIDGTLTIVARGAVPCPADITGDGSLDFFDVSAFLQLFNAGDLAADFNDDGSLNFFDVSLFLQLFGAGCP